MKAFFKLKTPVLISFLVVCFLISCKKDDCSNSPNSSSCNIAGSYLGTYTNQFGQTGSFYYNLGANYFVSSGASPTVTPTAFGSYSNTCDSVKIRIWNSANNSYYYLRGELSNNSTIITGVYENQTTPSETGPFTLNKQ